MVRRLAFPFALLLFCMSCSDFVPSKPSPRRDAISDAVHSGGAARFYFLPPLVPLPQFAGEFNSGVRPEVDVCEWTAGACLATIASFTMSTGTGGSVLRLSEVDEHFGVQWNTDSCVGGPCTLDPSRAYRIRVKVNGEVLGFADVDVVEKGSQLRNVDTDEFIPLLNGRTLPIRFRIEKSVSTIPETGGVTEVSGAEGGVVATSDGSLLLDVAAGSFPTETEPVAITVTSDLPSSIPDNPAIIGATIFHFGPEGLQFAQPATLKLTYDPAQLPAGATESRLRLFTVEGGIWRMVPGSSVDEMTNVVQGEIHHFSEYAVGFAPPVAGLAWSLSYASPPEGLPWGYWVIDHPCDNLGVNPDLPVCSEDRNDPLRPMASIRTERSLPDSAFTLFLFLLTDEFDGTAKTGIVSDRPFSISSSNTSIISVSKADTLVNMQDPVLPPVALVHFNVADTGTVRLIVTSEGVVDTLDWTVVHTKHSFVSVDTIFDQTFCNSQILGGSPGECENRPPASLSVGQTAELSVRFWDAYRRLTQCPGTITWHGVREPGGLPGSTISTATVSPGGQLNVLAPGDGEAFGTIDCLRDATFVDPRFVDEITFRFTTPSASSDTPSAPRKHEPTRH